MKFCPNCNNLLNISKAPPVARNMDTEIDTDADTDITITDNDTDVGTDTKKNIDTIGNLIDLLSDPEKINQVDSDDITVHKIEQITKHKKFAELDKKTKMNILMKITPYYEKIEDSNNAFYACKNCLFSKPIDAGSLIMTKKNNDFDNTYVNIDKLRNRLNSDVLPLTRNYVCHNNKCETHTGKVPREAVFFRTNGNAQVWFICKVCKTLWK